MREILKYPRTQHIRGSRLQYGDHDLEAVPWSELAGKHLIVEEKMDGSNVGISFNEDGTLMLQSRGHYLRGGLREKQFNLLKQWSSSKQEGLFGVLGTRYVMYGEWLAAKHTYFYDNLPHYFMEFDVLDTQTNEFLSTDARHNMLVHTNTAWSAVCPVLVLAEGKFRSVKELSALITRSNFITPTSRLLHLEEAARDAGVPVEDAIKHTDPSTDMEGLYVKWEEDGIVKGRYKFVRNSFTSAIMDQETHWHDRPIIQNKLIDGVFERMFT